MDIESDDSERWEDFFGSSTDLTPSLLGIYDTLTGSLVETTPKKQRSLPDLTEDKNEEDTTNNQNLNIEEILVTSKTSILDESDAEQESALKFDRNGKFSHSKICFISHNIQRLLQHTDSVKKIDGDAIRQQKISQEPKVAHKFVKKNQSKHQLVIPLSKTTSKITQSSKELVETFSSSTEYLDNIGSGGLGRGRNYPPNTPKQFDSEKTPTNATNEAFNFEIATPKKTTPVTPPSLLDTDEDIIEVDKVMELGALYDRDTNPKMADVIEAYNYSVGLSLSEVSTTSTDLMENSISSVETLAKSVEASPTGSRKPSPQSSPLLTYSRLSANKASTPISSPLSKTTNNEHSKTSMESLTDRLSEMKSKFSPRESRKMKLMPQEITFLKHRPLSSSSISSTSSSSSSGSEHIKPATSYLASVESLADHSENEIENRHGTYTVFERACMELVDTETNYVEDLGQVITGYLQDWRERHFIPPDQLSILFSNIEDIYDFNCTLLKQLITSGLNPAKIAKCFIDLRDRFDVYTTYCTSYPEAISLLTSLIQDTYTNAILNSTQKRLHHSLPLGSYLLKPVQRILRYHLLLDNLRKHCDVKEVSEAHEIMQDVAANINQVKRKLEQQSRVKELSGILDGWMGPKLTVLGDLRQEGILMEHNKPRSVFLFGTMLIITKPKEDGRLQFKRLIQQNNLMLNEHLPGEPTSFYVIPYDDPRSQIKLTARNREQKRVWAQDIKSVMLERFNNIPNRARELVYKLGDEEDRTPDTNKWKWPLNNSKPIYLERRNEFRRSEIRNRSKIKRKTSVTNSTSFEGFNNKQSELEHRALSKNLSMDDNMMATLPRTGGSTTTEECCSNAPDCECPTRSTKSSHINPALSKFNKERSKSVPRMSVLSSDLDEQQIVIKENLDSRVSKSTKSVEVKMYNTKTIPKRIATLKKNKSKKETSTFYMDLNDEFEETVLRITESTENLNEIEAAEEAIVEEYDSKKDEGQDQEIEKDGNSSNENTRKEDAQIVLDLVTKKIDFDRIQKKPQKKKSLENGSSPLNSPDPLGNSEELPPRPPSKSPPPLEVDESTDPSEPIYESLLRNVHVPYKFSPILNRSKSQQYYKPREKKSIPTNRPESDYVTLVYSASGNLQKIGDDLVGGFSGGAQLRSSDSKINYETLPIRDVCQSAPTSPEISSPNQPEAIYARPVTKNNLVKRLLSSSKSENVSGSESSLIPRVRKSIESATQSFGKINKPPERRVSDVTDMCRQSYLHRQGSEAVGERIANVDYADPKTLFTNGSVNNSAASLNIKGDSVFSLTSSSDSVFDFCKKRRDKPMNLEYLDNVAATCFEKDFRDSAIYSDDNEKRHDYGDSQPNGHSDSPPPLPPPRKSCGLSNPAVIVGPAHMSSSASRSWVMKQIENFNRENQHQ
ncbi:uncharacterized protein LOC129952814 [Eupeodes corollae]|uniref:uncharacterized protein LOC129952814 n=1 Tax=Eupeodes corollae TaxID=290404 RepID=UPI002492FEEC|nr:uncharacterized protein LOC129952814 [Eupeodes corollae]